MRFAYVYFMANAPERVRAVVPSHAAYWRERRLPGYLGGPFADRSGGLIVFDASTAADAEALVAGDPFTRQKLVAQGWTREWVAEPTAAPSGDEQP